MVWSSAPPNKYTHTIHICHWCSEFEHDRYTSHFSTFFAFITFNSLSASQVCNLASHPDVGMCSVFTFLFFSLFPTLPMIYVLQLFHTYLILFWFSLSHFLFRFLVVFISTFIFLHVPSSVILSSTGSSLLRRPSQTLCISVESFWFLTFISFWFSNFDIYLLTVSTCLCVLRYFHLKLEAFSSLLLRFSGIAALPDSGTDSWYHSLQFSLIFPLSVHCIFGWKVDMVYWVKVSAGGRTLVVSGR